MSTSVQRTSRSGRQSMFFHDLASPMSSHRGKFTSPGQAAAVSALWKENFGGTDPPPPPMFTLEDRTDFSPESGILDYVNSPETKSEMLRTPVRDSRSPLKNKYEVSTPYGGVGAEQEQKMQHTPASSSWWSPAKGSSDRDEKGRSSPVEGVVHPGALITVPPPREVARPEMQRNSLPVGNLNEEEWVTVYGFSPGDTNFVLREFEKCGVILKHVPGPRDANWVHILYQSRFDAQKALNKNGMQINGALIVGVKPLDTNQRQALNEGLGNQGFMTLPHTPSDRRSELTVSRTSHRTYYLQNNSNNAQQSAGAIASPAKSVVSKIMDLMFGI